MVALLLVMPALLRRVAALLLSVLTSLLAMVALLLVVPALLLPMAALLLAVAASPLTVYALVLTVAASLLPVALLMTVHMLLLAMVASLLAEPALLRRAAASLLPVAASLLPVAASLLPVAVSLLPVPASLLALLASLLAVSLLVRHLQSGSSNNNAITDQAVAAALGLRGGLGNWGGKRNVLAQLPLVPYPTPAFDPLVTELLAHGNPLHSILAVILVFCTAPSLLQVGHVLDLSWSEVRDYLLPVAELLEPLGLPEQYYSNFRISRQLQDFLLDPSRPETFVDIPRWHAFVAKWCFDRSYLFDRSHLNSDKR
ncbi:hypothetical protein C8J57DRAFT_1336223 [Mycena rebaudengoi]|nr:hypothetical protein C8J57DRAFT_1336223 [Mycena rebaudengoi]